MKSQPPQAALHTLGWSLGRTGVQQPTQDPIARIPLGGGAEKGTQGVRVTDQTLLEFGQDVVPVLDGRHRVKRPYPLCRSCHLGQQRDGTLPGAEHLCQLVNHITQTLSTLIKPWSG